MKDSLQIKLQKELEEGEKIWWIEHCPDKSLTWETSTISDDFLQVLMVLPVFFGFVGCLFFIFILILVFGFVVIFLLLIAYYYYNSFLDVEIRHVYVITNFRAIEMKMNKFGFSSLVTNIYAENIGFITKVYDKKSKAIRFYKKIYGEDSDSIIDAGFGYVKDIDGCECYLMKLKRYHK